MSTFQSEYETSTNAIDSIVTTQLSSVLNWMNVPGNLVKASSSAAGFVWGYNAGNSVYTCKVPCTGSWTQVDLSENQVSNILDLTTDDTNVYILFTNSANALSLLVTSATNQGTPTTIPVTFPAKSIFSTHTYIWAQDGSNHKEKCAKPCSMPNWQASTDKDVTITSSDNSTLYGHDAMGQAMQTDETMQSPWKPIGHVKGSIYGKGTDGSLYGIDPKQTAFKYNGKVSPLHTNGLTPSNISVDPHSNELWMTTSSPGNLGNVFMRQQTPDYSSMMNTITPLDQTRDKIVDNVETTFKRDTDVMSVNKQVEDIVKFFKTMFHIDGNTAKNAEGQSGKLNQNIREAQLELDNIRNIQPYIIGVICILVVLSIVYLFLSPLLGSSVHVISLIVVGGGLYLLIK